MMHIILSLLYKTTHRTLFPDETHFEFLSLSILYYSGISTGSGSIGPATVTVAFSSITNPSFSSLPGSLAHLPWTWSKFPGFQPSIFAVLKLEPEHVLQRQLLDWTVVWSWNSWHDRRFSAYLWSWAWPCSLIDYSRDRGFDNQQMTWDGFRSLPNVPISLHSESESDGYS